MSGLTLITVSADGAELPSSVDGFIKGKCIDCHDGVGGEGGFDVAMLGSDLSDRKTMDRWVRVFDRVERNEMPPPDSDALDRDDVKTFLDQTSDWLKSSQQQTFDQIGRVRSRRLTNHQTERTLQDLFGIDVPLANAMPQEPRTDGFTGLADHQSISHFQMESHLQVVDAALDAAFQRITETSQTYRREFTATDLARRNARQRCRDPEMIDGKAVVWSSGLVFYGRITSTRVPADGTYRITFTTSAVNQPADHGVWCSVRRGFCESGAPQLPWIGSFEATTQPSEHSYVAWIPKNNMVEIRPGDETLAKAKFRGGQVGSGEGEPQHVPGVALHSMVIERILSTEDIDRTHRYLFGDLNIVLDPKSNQLRLASDDPGKDVARQIKRFASRAFRRPVSEDELRPFLDWASTSIREDEDPIETLRASYRALLCSPRFMYFVEPAGQLDDYAIATRLSYMLCGSMPDWALTQLARDGKLRDPNVLDAEVDRLLGGFHGANFVRDFSDQWLDMADIDFTEPDPKLYHDFDIVVQNAMIEETHQYLLHLLKNDAPAKSLIKSNFTYLNSRLARYYDIDGVEGDELRKVVLTPDSHRGGLLAQGAVLKVTANGTNTSPVLRGVWVSERILGVTIPPPPENVPAIEPDIRGARTIREQLQKHLSDDSCSACHRHIDPPGYALENFDAAGRWRDQYLQVSKGKRSRGLPVDPSFVLADGRAFGDFDEFRDLVCKDIRPVARNFASQLMVYGTGRAIEFADRDDIESIVDRTKVENYGIRSLLKAVVASPTFLSK